MIQALKEYQSELETEFRAKLEKTIFRNGN